MGLSSSKKREENREKDMQEMYELQQSALRNYHYRLQQYDRYRHGSYRRYRHYVEAQYELDCLPECVKYSNNHPNHPRNRR